MDPSQPPLARTLSEISSDRTDRTVTIDGAAFDLRYAPEPGVDLRVEGSDPEEPDGVVASTVFDAADDRPPSYPPELPHLPGAKVSVLASRDRASPSAMWLVLDDVESALAEILAQSQAAGWSQSTEPGDPLPPGLRIIGLTRPGRRRSLIVSLFGENSAIMLSDEPADE